MNTSRPILNAVDKLSKAEDSFFKSIKLLEAIELPNEDDVFEQLHHIQLLLQYRLDTQATLNCLIKMQNNLWQLLGISAKHSLATNIERLGFALGHDDLQHVLKLVSLLVDALLRVVKRLEQVEANKKLGKGRKFRVRLTTGSTRVSLQFERHLKQASDYQMTAQYILKEVTDHVESLGGEPAVGPVLDHVAALEGPISRFFQAMQHGLILTAGLYQQVHQQAHLHLELSKMMTEVEQVLSLLPHTLAPEPARLFSHPTKELTPASIEERAANRRLGNFFNH